jgi:AcrR family transcriptional regulator
VPRKKTITEESLLDVARQVFVEHGFAASTKEIARRAGVSEALLFQRYRTKAELFFAAMVPPAIELGEQMRQVYPESELRDAIERLAFALLDYFRGALPVLAPLEAHPDFRFEEFAERHPGSTMVAMRRDIMAFFAANRVPDPGAAALLLMFSMRSVASFERFGAHGGHFPPDLIRRAVDALWRGIRPEARQPETD